MKYNPKTTAIPEIIPVVLICTAGIILPRPDSSLSCSFVTQGLFPPVGCISILLFCSTGIISAGRIHLYLALLLHRDYFRRSDCISIFLFCSTGIISTVRMHLYLPLLLHRDYFAPVGCISIFLFCSTGIISAARMHLYLALLLHRDDFHRSDSSLPCSFLPQGLFPPAECIPGLLFSSTGIISASRMHLYLAFLFHRDYFRRPDSSPACSFVTQGLFRPVECISIFLFCSTGMISAARIHLYLALLFHRDDFHRPNASLSCSFVTQGLFRPARCISILLFCPTGIISAGRMHPCLPLLLHRDDFCRPDSSPACSFVPQGLFLPPGCISNPGSCKVSATKLLLHRKHSYGFC